MGSRASALFIFLCLGHLAGCGQHATTDRADGSVPDARGDADPILHASGLGQPEHLLLDERALVWANKTQGTLMSLELATGEVRTLATGISGPEHALAMTDAHVYWAGWRDGTVMRVPRAGGDPELVASIAASSLPCGMAVSATHLYWTLFGGALQRVALDGGAVEDLTWATSSGPSSPIVSGDFLYVSSFSGAVDRLRIGPAADAALSSTWERLVTIDGSRGGLLVIAVDDQHVYGAVTNDSIVFRAPLAGGAIQILAEDLQPSDLEIAGGSLYMARAGAYGLARMPLAGGPIERLAMDSDSWSLAVGADRVYWSSHGGVDSLAGTVRSIPLP